MPGAGAGSRAPTSRPASFRSRICRSEFSGARVRRSRRAPGLRSASRSLTWRLLPGRQDSGANRLPRPRRPRARTSTGSRRSVARSGGRCERTSRTRLRSARTPTGSAAGCRGIWCRWRRRSCRFRSRLAISAISTPASITRRTSAGSSGPTTRCCPITSGCRSATTGGPPRSSCPERRWCVPTARRKRRMQRRPRSGRAGGSITRRNSVS